MRALRTTWPEKAPTSRPSSRGRRGRTPPPSSSGESVPSASSDEMVVKVYHLGHETTYLRASLQRRRARNPGGGIALAGCLHLAPLPDPSRQRQGRECLPDRPLLGLQPPDGAQRHPRLQREGAPAGASARLETSAHRS